MATDVSVILEKLCFVSTKPPNNRVDPYIWPALLRIDDNTIASNNPEDRGVAIVTPSRQNARIELKDGMRAGETADIPSSVGILRTRFEDNLTIRRLILVVVLLEFDETPDAAIEAGFLAFGSELRKVVTQKFLALDSAEKSGDEEEAKRIREEIGKRVGEAVRSAIEDNLSAWEKTKVFAGFMDLDHTRGRAFIDFGADPLVSRPITLTFESAATFKKPGSFPPEFFEVEFKFEIQGRLQGRPLSIDRCQPQVDAVKAAQSVVNSVEEEIRKLQAQLRGEGSEPPLSKSFLMSEIKRLRQEELGPAEAVLEEARRALQSCRILKDRAVEPGGVATA